MRGIKSWFVVVVPVWSIFLSFAEVSVVKNISGSNLNREIEQTYISFLFYDEKNSRS